MRKAKKEKKNPNDSMVKVFTDVMLALIQILQTYYNVPLRVKFVNFLLLMTNNYIH